MGHASRFISHFRKPGLGIFALIASVYALGIRPADAAVTASLGLAYSAISFLDSRYPAFLEKTLTWKGDVTLRARQSRFEFGIGGYNTAVVLSSTTEMRPSFVGVNARIGYDAVSRPTWRLTLSGGWSYSIMRTEYYGYDRMPALVLRAALRKEFAPRKSAGIYFKYAPALVDRQISFLHSGEVAAGADYTFGVGDKKLDRWIFIFADASTYTLTLEEARITSQTASAGLGLRFQ